MGQYISKDALVAEIEKLKHRIDDRYSYSSGWKDALLMVEAELDTLEVKEVDQNEKCKDLNADGTCAYAFDKTQRIMRCEKIHCSRKLS